MYETTSLILHIRKKKKQQQQKKSMGHAPKIEFACR